MILAAWVTVAGLLPGCFDDGSTGGADGPTVGGGVASATVAPDAAATPPAPSAAAQPPEPHAQSATPTLPETGDFEARRVALNAEVRALIADLEAAGRYDCCIQTPCKHCAMFSGGCRCGEGLRKGEPVCEECALMWEQGQGAEDVPPNSVRSFTEAARVQTGKICGAAKLGNTAVGSPRSAHP